jgi:lysophospholipase L1-like esterase
MLPRFTHALLLAVLAMAFGLPSTFAGSDAPAIKLMKDDRIVFFGDSITAAGAGKKGYITFIGEQLQAKDADLNIKLIGAGVSGNKVPDLQRRLDSAVLAKKPTIVVIYIGINDVWHGEKDPSRGTTPEKFEAGLKEIIGKIQSAGSRVLLCTPSVIGEKKDNGNNLDQKLDEYAAISRKVAKDTKVPLCDLRKAFVDYLKTNNPQDKASGILTSDRVHLNEAGNRFVAAAMLKSLGKN